MRRFGLLATMAVLLSGCAGMVQNAHWMHAIGGDPWAATPGYYQDIEARWQAHGFQTPQEACQYADHLNVPDGGLCRLDIPDEQIAGFAAERDAAASLTPEQTAYASANGLTSTQMQQDIALRAAGFNEADALTYAREGETLAQVQADQKQQQELAATEAAERQQQQDEAAAALAAGNAALANAKRGCPGRMLSVTDLVYSEGGTVGDCYEIPGVFLTTQWASPSVAIAGPFYNLIVSDIPIEGYGYDLPPGMYEAIGTFTYRGHSSSILLFTGLPYMPNMIGLSGSAP
jgi:hypothetical protein